MNSELMLRGSEIARDAAREAQIVNTVDIMSMLPDLLDCVSLNKEYILETVEHELTRPTVNPLNIFLKLFGLRVIHTRKTVRDIDGNFSEEDTYTVSEERCQESGQFLCLDEKAFQKKATSIAARLHEAETEFKETEEYLKTKNSSLYSQIKQGEESYRQILSDYDGCKQAVAERAQYLLSSCGENCQDVIATQICELLSDLDMEAVWMKNGGTHVSDAEFTVLRCADPEKHKAKPCIMDGRGVRLKGIVFVQDEE